MSITSREHFTWCHAPALEPKGERLVARPLPMGPRSSWVRCIVYLTAAPWQADAWLPRLAMGTWNATWVGKELELVCEVERHWLDKVHLHASWKCLAEDPVHENFNSWGDWRH